MKCFITGHTGERVDERKRCDDEVRTFMKFKMLHNGICRRMNLLLITTVKALTGFAETSEEDGTAGATSNQVTVAFLCGAVQTMKTPPQVI